MEKLALKTSNVKVKYPHISCNKHNIKTKNFSSSLMVMIRQAGSTSCMPLTIYNSMLLLTF